MKNEIGAFLVALSVAAAVAIPPRAAQAAIYNPASCAVYYDAVGGKGGFLNTTVDFFGYLGAASLGYWICLGTRNRPAV